MLLNKRRSLTYKITVVFMDGSVSVYRQDKPLINHGDHYLFDPQDGYYGVSIPFHNVRTVLTTTVDDTLIEYSNVRYAEPDTSTGVPDL